jgi:hypothetical protein
MCFIEKAKSGEKKRKAKADRKANSAAIKKYGVESNV